MPVPPSAVGWFVHTGKVLAGNHMRRDLPMKKVKKREKPGGGSQILRLVLIHAIEKIDACEKSLSRSLRNFADRKRRTRPFFPWIFKIYARSVGKVFGNPVQEKNQSFFFFLGKSLQASDLHFLYNIPAAQGQLAPLFREINAKRPFSS